MKDLKFYRCQRCGNLIQVVSGSLTSIMCCGQEITELIPNTVEAATEKHVPIVVREGGSVKVTVSSVIHPMLEEHFIQWINVETDKGVYRKHLKPGEEPVAMFEIGDEELKEVYEYCNLHGLWKA